MAPLPANEDSTAITIAAMDTELLKAVTARQRFWVHDACARFSPEVHVALDGTWYNVTAAVRRGKKLRCIGCQERGATIGCFEPKCRRSFHLGCTGKPIENFRQGIVFWCPQHEVKNHKFDTYIDIFSCNRCDAQLDDTWFSCTKCEDFFQTYDLCSKCFTSETDPWNHEHTSNVFTGKSKDMIVNQTIIANNTPNPVKKQRKHWTGMRGVRFARVTRCSYCWTDASPTWRKIFNGVRFKITLPTTATIADAIDALEPERSSPPPSLLLPPPSPPPLSSVSIEDTSLQTKITLPDEEANATMAATTASSCNAEQLTSHEGYVGDVDDYMHNPYLTRRCYTDGRFEETQSNAKYLESYGPEEHQMYSLPYDSTYFDIPGRAPRCKCAIIGVNFNGLRIPVQIIMASIKYIIFLLVLIFVSTLMIIIIGTWLPQTVRRALLRYTRQNDRILSNFLGRGTDAIESFLLQRRCVGVDINPTAVALSQKNCSFAVPPEFGITGDLRPIILKSDARYLEGNQFIDGSYDHVLSHPPYKDCVEYSAGLQGDLSRFANSQEFYQEMAKVAQTAWRLLKPGGRCTIGIGDNREFCFYIPVGFDLLRTYIDNGYQLEELVVKRQRYCSAFGLGTFLCVQYDFLCFTHEFIITPTGDYYALDEDITDLSTTASEIKQILRRVPALPISRQSVIMGTVWTFRADTNYTFSQLCMSRMVERFGKDDTNWKEICLYHDDSLKKTDEQPISPSLPHNEPEGDSAPATYEERRKKQIVENNQMLMSLGLLRIWVMMPMMYLIWRNYSAYRCRIVQAAQQAYADLCVSGFFIVGLKDVRIPHVSSNSNSTDPQEQLLYPLGMLVLEDMNRAFRTDQLKLKELVVTVPNGYSRDPYKWDKNYQEIHINDLPEDSPQRYLPIVHVRL
ncbi:hypothetical protein BDF19DRAFT_416323 [Syncephalis fuscata]|nr:hypothetical protein BDF19DRAFT_416323 [Syncephalis fuscata]